MASEMPKISLSFINFHPDLEVWRRRRRKKKRETDTTNLSEVPFSSHINLKHRQLFAFAALFLYLLLSSWSNIGSKKKGMPSGILLLTLLALPLGRSGTVLPDETAPPLASLLKRGHNDGCVLLLYQVEWQLVQVKFFFSFGRIAIHFVFVPSHATPRI